MKSRPERAAAVERRGVHTDPAGAKVYQFPPLSDQRVYLGTTPLDDQNVMVLTKYTVTGPPEAATTLTNQLGRVKVVIEHAGYNPYEGHLSTGRTAPVVHEIALEPIE